MMKKKYIAKIGAILTYLFSATMALAQTTPFSTYVTGLAPATSLTGSERLAGLQSGTPKTITPYLITGTIVGDCTVAVAPNIICLKTNGVNFSASATIDTTNAANISSGTLGLPRLALTSAFFYVGNVSNNPAGVAMSGDCTLANTGAVTCLKVNGVTFAASATTDTTNATNIGTGTLAGARYAAVNLAAGGNGGVTGLLPFANHPTGSLDTVAGYWGTTTLSAIAMNNCTGSLTYSTSTHTFGCNAGAGSGNVINSGTPTVNQIGVWVDATHLKGQAITALATINVVKIQTFPSSGTFTYTPSAGLQYAIIECLAAGGGGGFLPDAGAGNGGSAGAGGAGSYSRKIASAATIGVSQSVVVGALGGGGTSGSGGNGGDSSVGSLCIGKGGLGGGIGPNGTGGLGGQTGTGDLVTVGATGETGVNQAIITITTKATMGGSSIWGSSSASNLVCAGNVNAGQSAAGFGAGGGGGCTQNGAGAANGGNGSAGEVVITEFTNQ